MKNNQKKINKMKYLLPLLLMVYSIASAQNSQEIPKRYEIKSAKVTYTENSPEGKGTKVLFFDQYGMRESKRETLQKKGKTVKDQLSIINNRKVFIINMLDHTGIARDLSGTMQMMQMGGNDMAATGKNMLKTMGGKMTGHVSFLGKNCEKWEVNTMGKTTMLLWKAIPLKSESKIMGIGTVEEATSIQTGKSFTASDFEPPAGIKMEQTMPQGMDMGLGGADLKMTNEDKQQLEKLKNMSFADFKKMMKKENPDITDEELQQSFKIMKKMGTLIK